MSAVMFDKSDELFPSRKQHVFVAHCGVSPLYAGAFRRECEAAERHSMHGGAAFADYQDTLDALRRSAARLLRTSPGNLALVRNTSEALCMVANGYPFAPGDEIVSYVHEYPANHYPWRLQERRGVKLTLLPDRSIPGAAVGRLGDRPCGWTMEDLEERITARTRIVAISHVQFTSGFAADLRGLGAFCDARGIDLIVDAAQSLGSLPVFPDAWNVSALAASGWKWLLGPVGTGIFYTSERFRNKLEDVMVGAETMVQGMDYLNHAWKPHTSARRFEYSTSAITLAAALEACLSEVFLRYDPWAVRQEICRLQDLLLGAIDRDWWMPVVFDERHRSGILSLACPGPADAVMSALAASDIICSARGGYLRVAPHFYNTEEDMELTAAALNGLAGQVVRPHGT